MAISTAFCTSAKSDMMSALTCTNQIRTPTGDTTSGAFTIANVSALTGLAVGMLVAGTGVPVGSILASIDSSTGITISKAATATASTVALTATGDAFKIALVKVAPAGTYGPATTNYTELTGNSDEVSGTGYTAGGVALVNTSPTTSGTTAFNDFADPSWTSATFSTTGAMIYNNSRRGPVATRSVSTHDFGGTQTVTAGTLTLVMPAADASNAIWRLS